MKLDSSPIEGVADVEVLRGVAADPDASPDLLVEVPHGADRRAHYDALRARLAGPLPEDLHVFFHANTDLGAWHYGRRVAERVVEADPTKVALVIRCLLPRTFVDTNRVIEAVDELATGGMTAAIPSYVRDPADRARLVELHRTYVERVEACCDAICGAGGFALLPHTYGPRSMGIARVDDHIVEALRAAYAPDAWATWPIRPEIDLITKDPEGAMEADARLTEALLAAYRERGFEAVDSETYSLHPSSQGARWSARYPGQVLGLEVRRDLLVERFDLFEELTVDPARVERVAAPLAEALGAWFSRRAS